jgi:MarC family integral membrane protein
MKEHLQALITVLSLVNPVVCGSMFARIEAHRARGDKVTDATKTALSIATILVIAALLGTQLLDMFGVSLDAFMVAGGGVLSWMGYRMLMAGWISGEWDELNCWLTIVWRSRIQVLLHGTLVSALTTSNARSLAQPNNPATFIGSLSWQGFT